MTINAQVDTKQYLLVQYFAIIKRKAESLADLIFWNFKLKSSIIWDDDFCHFWLRFHRRAEQAQVSHCIHIQGSSKLFDIHDRVRPHNIDIHTHHHRNSPHPHFPYSSSRRCPKSQDYKRLRFDSWIDRKLEGLHHQDIHPRYCQASNMRKNWDNRDG